LTTFAPNNRLGGVLGSFEDTTRPETEPLIFARMIGRVQLERMLVADAAISVLRHNARNRLGAIVSALTYLQKRVEKSPGLADEPQMAQFFGLCFEEADAIAHSIQPVDPTPWLRPADCDLRRALVDAFGGAAVVHVPPTQVLCDPTALAIATDAIARVFASDARCEIELTSTDDTTCLTFRGDSGEPELPPGLDPYTLDVGVARRAAVACGGSVSVVHGDGRALVKMTLPRPS
jgi:hypothetical protein